MKTLLITFISILALADCSVAIAKTKAGQKAKDFEQYKEFNLNTDGFEENKQGWIIRVDRNRVFDKFVVTMPVSTEKWPSGVVEVDEDGKEKKDAGLLPFERTRVRSLVICGNEVSEKLRKKGCAFETISLKGIEELTEIVIRGEIPRFEEQAKWFGLKKENDWRRGLKRIVLEDQVDGLTNISFLGEVKCLSFGTNAVRQICEKWGSDCTENGLTDLGKCYGLEQLEVPYCMATNTAIRWGALIRNSPLKDREVVSFESVGSGDKAQRVVLLNLGASGEISDYVTTIRADAIPADFRKCIRMPFRAKEVIGGRIPQGLTLSLKRGGLLFSPDITAPADAKRLCDSRSVIRTCPVRVATAYEGLALSNSVGIVSSDFEQDGSSWSSSLSLLRGKNLENRVFAHLELSGVSYPVRIPMTKGSEKDSVSLTFKYGSLGWTSFVLGLTGACVLIVVILGIVWPWGLRRGFGRQRMVLASLGVGVGVLVSFLGMGGIGVLQHYTDTYLTGKAMAYLNSSFVSSLVISVSVTIVKLVIGFLQGLKLSLVFVGMDINSVFQPVQDVLDKISTYSWISTAMLAFVSVVCRVLRDCAACVWVVLGVSLVVFSILDLGGHSKGTHWIGRVVSVAMFLSLGIPIVLCCCAWFSYRLSDISGAAFNQSMTDFMLLAQSCSWESLKSMAAVQELLVQFTDAVSGLISSAMYYIATKAFDCFLVPLMLYVGLKMSLKGFSDGREAELIRIREILAGQTHKISEMRVPLAAHGEPNARLPLSEGTEVFSEPRHQGRCAERPYSTNCMPAYRKFLKPEWVTAIAAVALCLLLPLTTFRDAPSAVVVNGDGAEVLTALASPTPERKISEQQSSKPITAGVLVFSVLSFAAFLLFEFWCFRKAKGVCSGIQRNELVTSAQDKLKMLNESSYWLDLPLYGGLGGTVLGFLIISIPRLEFLMVGGRIVAYMSTLLGIGATWWIQRKIVSPYKTKLMEQMAQEGCAHE